MMKPRLAVLFASVALFCLFLAMPAAGQTVWHVDRDAPAGGDGLSWATAFKQVQGGLNAATAGDEVWVAEGVYTRPGHRNHTFSLKSGVDVYGGFNGTEQNRADRDWTVHPTILSGDRLGNDGPNFINYEDNNYHVVTAAGVIGARLDGFIVTAGNAEESNELRGVGAGLNIDDTSSNIVVENCTFSVNFARIAGAGCRIRSATTLIACIFDGNATATHGGAVDIETSAGTTQFHGCEFTDNSSDNEGGAIFIDQGIVEGYDCLFLRNSADQFGGAIRNQDHLLLQTCIIEENGGDWAVVTQSGLRDTACLAIDCVFRTNDGALSAPGGVLKVATLDVSGSLFEQNQGAIDIVIGPLFVDSCEFRVNAETAITHRRDFTAVITNSIFADNANNFHAGAIRSFGPSDITIANCSFERNSSINDGGGVHLAGGTATITDCIFADQVAQQSGGGVFANGMTEFVMRDCAFISNTAGGGAGMYLVAAEAEISGSFFESNDTTQADGGGLLLWTGSYLVNDCTFMANSARNGGGIYNVGSAYVVNCGFFGNSTTGGGSAFSDNFEGSTLANCLISGNSSRTGAIYVDTTTVIANCVLAHNMATNQGAGITVGDDGHADVSNSVLWGNMDIDGIDEEAQLRLDDGTVNVNYTCIDGLTGGLGGAGNIADDPLFVDADGADDVFGTLDDDLRMQKASPVIDAGDNSYLPPDTFDLDGDGDTTEPLPIDFAGNLRVINQIVDMGGYEAQTGDLAGRFTGPAGGTWFDPNHWAGGEIPGAMTNVLLPVPVVVDQHGAVAASVTIADGGVLQIADGSVATPLVIVSAGGGVLLDHASAVLDAGEIRVDSGAAFDWTSGTVILTSGAWTNPTPITFGGATSLLLLRNNAEVIAPGIDIGALGALRGEGLIDAPAESSGLIAPGESPGLLTFSQDLILTSSSTLEIGLQDFGFGMDDKVVVNGAATLAGALDVSLDSGAAQPLPAQFDIVVAASINGRFNTIMVPLPAGEFVFSTVPGATAVAVHITSNAAQGPVVFVRDDASPFGTGSTWANAVDDLQKALEARAANPVIEEAWVAAGIYVPSVPGGPGATFRLEDSFALYGGFTGSETERSQRDFTANVTILSGDVNGDDQPGWQNRSDNIRNVVTAISVGSTAVVDGFTIRGGYSAHPDFRGGGVHCDDGDATFENCIITDNQANLGAGAYLRLSNATFRSCDFIGNRTGPTSPASSDGGGVHARGGGHPQFIDCSFVENNTDIAGGGIYAFNTHITCIECLFEDNGANTGGGGIWIEGNRFLSVDTCQFINNHNYDPNRSIFGGAIVVAQGAETSIIDSTFDSNLANEAGAVYIEDAGETVMLSNCSFVQNAATRFGGAILVNRSHPVLTGCEFTQNVADEHGGAAYLFGSTDREVEAIFDGCTFDDNIAGAAGGSRRGGGVYAVNPSTAEEVFAFLNCQFDGNSASEFGGHAYIFGNLILDTTTFANGTAPQGSGVYQSQGHVIGSATFSGGDDFVNRGSFSPGFTTGGPQIATLALDGAYIREAFAFENTIFMDINGYAAGTDFDLIDASQGTLAIGGGGLHLRFGAGFDPQVGDAFQVMASSVLNGGFDLLTHEGLTGDKFAEATLSNAGVMITIEELQSAPNFLFIGDVDLSLTPTDSVLVDVDNDSHPDLAVIAASGATAKLFVFINQGNDANGEWLGFSTTPAELDIEEDPVGVAVADIDGDTFADLIVGHQGPAIATVLRNTGSGGIFEIDATYPTATSGGDIVTGLIDGDASIDFIVLESLSNRFLVFLNNGSGGFSQSSAINTYGRASAAALADVDKDADLDILIANAGNPAAGFPPRFTYHRGNGAGGFSGATPLPIGVDPVAVVARDFDGDTYIDAAVLSRTSGVITVFTNDGQGGLPGGVNAPAGPDARSMDVLDMENDGDPDLAVVLDNPVGDPVVRIVRNDSSSPGTIVLATAGDLVVSGEPRVVQAGDLDLDGLDDLVTANAAAGPGPAGATASNLLNITPPTSNPATLTDVAMIFGSLVAGDLSDLVASDNLYFHTLSQFGFSAQEANLTEILIGSTTEGTVPSSFTIGVESRINNPGGAATLRIRNWTTNQFETLLTYSIDGNETREEIADVDPTDRIGTKDSRVELAVRHTVVATFAASGFESFFDQVEIDMIE